LLAVLIAARVKVGEEEEVKGRAVDADRWTSRGGMGRRQTGLVLCNQSWLAASESVAVSALVSDARARVSVPAS
jgi:hypothetical protein